MHHRFSNLVEDIDISFQNLLQCNPHKGPCPLPLNVPSHAVYLFSEGEDYLYVGRTNRLRSRHKEHWSGRQNDAPFAFKLARHTTNNLGKGGPTRAVLFHDPAFSEAFKAARARISQMEFRWIEEKDANRQCLLEIYTTIVLNARYNDFENH